MGAVMRDKANDGVVYAIWEWIQYFKSQCGVG